MSDWFMAKNTRWLIFLPAACLALYSSVTHAEPIQGLDTTYYVIDEIPPLQSTTEYEECGSELENNINRSYDGEPYEDCTEDLFMVHMTGFITIPEHDTIEFWLASDDGGEISIGGNTWGSWQDQGCSATVSGNLTLETGSQPLEVWMYENGGGTCLMLAWKIDDNQWEIVPEWAFTTTSTPQTTTSTTTVPSTTVPATDQIGTTLPETTTSSAPTTSLPQSEPTMPEPSTTTTTTTTSLVPETTTTTEPVSPPVAQPPVEVQPEPIEEPATEDTEPTPVVTEPVEETIPLDPPDTYPTVEIADTLPFVEEPEVDEPVVDIPIPDSPPNAPESFLSDEELNTIVQDDVTVEALTEALEELTEEEVSQVLEAILEEEPTQEQATAIASSPAALAVLTSEQATQVFEALDVTELDNTQLEALAEAVSDAPTEVKEAFEDSVDVFSDGLGTYVPVDSKIPVSERRTLIAIAAGATLTAASTRMRR
jgi:hypothetical protein